MSPADDDDGPWAAQLCNYPEGYWRPGLPLYVHPEFDDEDWGREEVREMLEFIDPGYDEAFSHPMNWCPPPAPQPAGWSWLGNSVGQLPAAAAAHGRLAPVW